MALEFICPGCGHRAQLDAVEPRVAEPECKTVETVIPTPALPLSQTCDSTGKRSLLVADEFPPPQDTPLPGSLVLPADFPLRRTAGKVERPAEQGEANREPTCNGSAGSSASEQVAKGSRALSLRLPSGWSWTTLLTLYSSLITLGLAGFLIRDVLRARPGPAAPTLPSDTRGQDTDPRELREWLGQLPLIPANRRIRLGETCRVGDLEVKPLSLSRQPVELEHVPGVLPPRFGGDDALALRILVKSLSENESFAPMAREHVREPDRGVSESVIETSSESRIRNYPLSHESEWRIVGQSFATLSPGESTEIMLWSEPGCEKRMTERMLWRVPLRTGSARVEWIGVEFSRADSQ